MNKKKQKTIYIGSVGVDSGQLMVCDPCYIDSHWTKNTQKNGSLDVNTDKFGYTSACKSTLKSKLNGGDCSGDNDSHLAVATSTAFGDGVYNVYQKYINGQLKELIIKL